MSDHQIHFSRRFYLNKKYGYWVSVDYPRIRAHQWVWINIHGLIPKGYHIHHRNNDKSDNRIENLELIEKSRHLSYHLNLPERKEQSRKIIEKIRPLTKKWHVSEEGRKWHRIHALESNFGNWEPKKYSCQLCNAEFESKKRSKTRFCSNACKSKWRRDNKIDHIEKICLGCNKAFLANRYSKIKTCGRKCGGIIKRKK